MKEILSKLRTIYNEPAIKRDVWGRRPATPKEIEGALKEEGWEDRYLPTEEDVARKGDE